MSQLRFDLRRALQDFEARTGIRLSYDALGQRSGVSIDAIKSMATRADYNATLRIVGQVCDALKCNPIDYLEWNADD